MGISASAVARVVGIDTVFKNLRGSSAALLPQRVAIVGQGSTAATYALTKLQITSAAQAGSVYGFGSPIHLAALQLLPVNGTGVGQIPVTVYPLDDDGAGVVASGDITPGGSPTSEASYIVRINNIDSEPFVVSVGDVVADIVTAMTAVINASLNVPIIAADDTTKVDFTSKWEGVSANDIVVEVVGSTTAGNTFGITQAAGGLNNPDVDTALALVGNVWETMFLNCMEVTDTTTLGRFTTFGEGRWGAEIRKPMIAFVGDVEASVTTSIAVPDARKTDRVNSQLVSPGSNDLPFVVAARQLSRIAVEANEDPPSDYGSQPATGLTPGSDSDQWTQTERDQAVKAGSSTIEVRDSVVTISDVVTFYHPVGEEPPAYRYVVDIVKLMQVLYNLDLEFVSTEWDGAPLIPDGQTTSNRSARTPSAAVAAVATIIDGLALAAIISDPKTAKSTITAVIDSGNPKRLNIDFTIQLSGNANIIDITNNFGFFFGTPSLVA